MSKEFTVHLTGGNRLDLWMFIFQYAGVKPTTKDQTRSLEAVLVTFKMYEVQEYIDEKIAEKRDGGVLPSEFEDVECSTGSVDLKRLYDYLETMPDGAPVGLRLRLLKLADYLQDVKDKRPRLETVPEGA